MRACQNCWNRPGRRRLALHREALELEHVAFRPAGQQMAQADPQEEDDAVYRVTVDGFEMEPRRRFAVYAMTVSRGNARWAIRRRFNQIFSMHQSLVRSFGRSAMKDGLPRLPPKVSITSICCGQRAPQFLAARACRLQRYFDELLRYIVLVEQCEPLYEFLCSVDVNHMSYEALLDLGQALGSGNNAPPVSFKDACALPTRSTVSFCQGMWENCVICQDEMAENEDVRILACGHQYHFRCIARWLQESNTCCVCQSMAVVPSPVKSSVQGPGSSVPPGQWRSDSLPF